MSSNQQNKASHTWTPTFKVETQFGRKPLLLSSLSSIFIIKKTSYNFVLAQTHTSTQAPTCRRLQPSLIFQLQLEGNSNPLILFTSLSWKGALTPWNQSPASISRKLLLSYWRLQPSDLLLTTFHQFSYWIKIASIQPLNINNHTLPKTSIRTALPL